jgi:hypothetical protein
MSWEAITSREGLEISLVIDYEVAFLLRPLERTFPFSSVCEDFAASDFLEAFAMPQSITLPFRDIKGKVMGVAARKQRRESSGGLRTVCS